MYVHLLIPGMLVEKKQEQRFFRMQVCFCFLNMKVQVVCLDEWELDLQLVMDTKIVCTNSKKIIREMDCHKLPLCRDRI